MSDYSSGMALTFAPHCSRCAVLEADLAALREQRCETCRHSVRYTDNGSLYCYVLRNALNDVPCQLVGYRCGAWARREP